MTANPNAVPSIARKLKSSKVSCRPIPLVWIGIQTGATLLLIPPQARQNVSARVRKSEADWSAYVRSLREAVL